MYKRAVYRPPKLDAELERRMEEVRALARAIYGADEGKGIARPEQRGERGQVFAAIDKAAELPATEAFGYLDNLETFLKAKAVGFIAQWAPPDLAKRLLEPLMKQYNTPGEFREAVDNAWRSAMRWFIGERKSLESIAKTDWHKLPDYDGIIKAWREYFADAPEPVKTVLKAAADVYKNEPASLIEVFRTLVVNIEQFGMARGLLNALKAGPSWPWDKVRKALGKRMEEIERWASAEDKKR